jgi:hypothetical protein
MSNGNYLNAGRLFPIDNGEGKVSQEKPAGTEQIGGPSLWALRDVVDRSVNFPRKFLSGTGLRSKYQSIAASYSCTACSRNSSRLLAMTELGSNPAPYFIPGDGFGFAGIKLLNASSYLVMPRVFSRRLIQLFKAIDERARKSGALIRWQRQRFFQQIIGFLSHARIARQR